MNWKLLISLIGWGGFLFLHGFVQKSFSYSNFIGHGYASCLTCHYNAFGNGPLNDYGRAVSANLIGGRVFAGRKTSDEKLSRYSGFFGKVDPKGHFRPSLDYRGLYLTRNLGKSNDETNYIHMQADANLVTKWNRDRVVTSVSYGMSPKYSNGFQDYEWEEISREHYLMVAFNKSTRVYAGKTDFVYGIRVPDHTAYSRGSIYLDKNDQTHGVSVHYLNKKVEGGVHAFVGDLSDEEEIRESGGSTMWEFVAGKMFRPGFSYLKGSHDFRDRDMMAVHVRWAPFIGSSFLLEVGKADITERTSSGSTEVESTTERTYTFLQNQNLLTRGLYHLNTWEQLTTKQAGSQEKSMRLTTGLQWFPAQRLEFRFEVSVERYFPQNTVRDDSWSMTNQVHLWF